MLNYQILLKYICMINTLLFNYVIYSFYYKKYFLKHNLKKRELKLTLR